jgi:hypothetical protein
MPPGVALCAWATLAVAVRRHDASRMRIGVVRFICPQTIESFSLPSIRLDIGWSPQWP